MGDFHNCINDPDSNNNGIMDVQNKKRKDIGGYSFWSNYAGSCSYSWQIHTRLFNCRMVHFQSQDLNHPCMLLWFLCFCTSGLAAPFPPGLSQFNNESFSYWVACCWGYYSCSGDQDAGFHIIWERGRTNNSG